jgi:D-alanine-D-alanine ligase
MQQIRVGVLRGGISPEYGVSLETGKNVLEHLPRVQNSKGENKYRAIDILITKDGTWHMNGIPTTAEKLQANVDVIWNALHGFYGEDGKVQQLLDNMKIPYTGSEAFPSSIGMHKVLSKEKFRSEGMKTPRHEYIVHPTARVLPEFYHSYISASVANIIRDIPLPWIIKPVNGGSSLGITLVSDFSDLESALIEMFQNSPDDILVEEFIVGREATVGVVDHFRGEERYAFLPIEIDKDPESHFGFEEKYNGQAREISPGRFSEDEKRELQRLASEIHRILNLRHYSRSDFIVTKNRGIYVIEANTLPGLTKESLLPKSLETIGASFSHFLDHVITLALKK